MLLDVIGALFYFYVLLFSAMLFLLFTGLRMLYKSYQLKDQELLRQAKFVLLFAIIGMLCIATVSFFETGKLPID